MRNPDPMDDFIRDVASRAVSSLIADAVGVPRTDALLSDALLGAVAVSEGNHAVLSVHDPQLNPVKRVVEHNEPEGAVYLLLRIPQEADGGA